METMIMCMGSYDGVKALLSRESQRVGKWNHVFL